MTKKEVMSWIIDLWGSPAWIGTRSSVTDPNRRFAVGIPGARTPLVFGAGRSWEAAVDAAVAAGFTMERAAACRKNAEILKERWDAEDRHRAAVGKRRKLGPRVELR